MSAYGVVLGGGGAKGIYEIGVWKALRELQIPVCAVAGTSVGALNGAMMVQGDYELAENVWTGMTVADIINLEKQISDAGGQRDKISALIGIIKNMILSGGLDVSPLKKMLYDVIDEKKIRESETDFGLVTFSLTDFKPLSIFKKDIPDGKLVEYLLASACLPAFKPQQIEGKRFIDGGVYDNIPISLMVQKDIKDIIVVDVDGIGLNKRVNNRELNITYIKASENLGGTLSFDGQRSGKNMELGYYDALKAFDRLKGKKYYIIPYSDYEEYKKRYLGDAGINDFKKLYEFLGIKWGKKLSATDRLILYKIIKTIRKYAGEKLSMRNVIPAMAEITAEQMGIDRIEVYTLDKLIEKIELRYESIKGDRDFKAYMDGIRHLVSIKNQKQFNIEVKNMLVEGKFLIYYIPGINDDIRLVYRFRKFMALTFTKVCIANLFISFVLSRKNL